MALNLNNARVSRERNYAAAVARLRTHYPEIPSLTFMGISTGEFEREDLVRMLMFTLEEESPLGFMHPAVRQWRERKVG